MRRRREQVAARWLQPQADRLAPAGAGGREDPGEAPVPGYVDGVLVATAAECHVCDGPGEVVLAGCSAHSCTPVGRTMSSPPPAGSGSRGRRARSGCARAAAAGSSSTMPSPAVARIRTLISPDRPVKRATNGLAGSVQLTAHGLPGAPGQHRV
jgi:hypothetical protein